MWWTAVLGAIGVRQYAAEDEDIAKAVLRRCNIQPVRGGQ
jgi:hypothetical protein